MYKNFSYAVDSKENVLSWKVTGHLEVSEIDSIVDEIKNEVLKLPNGRVKLLVDNRAMIDEDGKDILFTKVINDKWIALQEWLIPYCSHVAVLCGSLMMKAQMNRLAQTSGLSEVLKAYWSPNDPKQSKALGDALEFLGVQSHPLVK